jgi:hypothetical protein
MNFVIPLSTPLAERLPETNMLRLHSEHIVIFFYLTPYRVHLREYSLTTDLIGLPCGVPNSLACSSLSSIIPDFRYLRINRNKRSSFILR